MDKKYKEQMVAMFRDIGGKVVAEIVEERFKKLEEDVEEKARVREVKWAQKIAGEAATSLHPRDPGPVGLTFGGVMRCMAAGKADPEKALAYAEKVYGKEHDVTAAIKSGLEKQQAATDATAGGFMVIEQVSTEVVELLRSRAVIRAMGATILGSDTGVLSIPKVTGGATSTYIGENIDIPKSELQFGDLKFTAKKLVTLVPISNDFIRRAISGSEAIIRDDSVRSMRLREDLAFIRGDGLQDTPKGILNLVPAAHKFDANGTINLDNVTLDLSNAILKLDEADVELDRAGWLWAPRTSRFLMTLRDGNGNLAFQPEMVQGTLMGWPFAKTNQIPKNLGGGSDESEVYFVEFSDAVIAETLELIIDSSTEAAYIDSGTLVSSFSRDQTVLRLISEHDFNLRHDESAAVIQAVKWGA